ncbi:MULTISPECIES: bidirectional hydrogenase complex protein HoxU [Synechococcaceae]|uniref:bidirectional hydrogenase complex protein HoxU n=1 Tax=Synechococcaceae TaxID=1890426 RepID=UPI0008FF1F40|nr:MULTISPECIES: bidirectional hydrogenase complex protein HoxU [Synechococcaceae]MCT4365951.1 bidirectional hydrogenase complex protein HoxU [Candidatus Regnicoccus frigidus MAG-AL1]APD48826.1 bidirectional hydrogenase complex protein HoxU [Synechococcus sp. SynAce01]MCT0245148.1 bidirectional hydrogenase complex protein HoxU [Synechococcus sp. CS-601]MCT4366284.1 bidirectional hydrogenase complex protein HoxU [Candidatus Regnicoccus frigidus MAG-AL2]TWB87167.1 NAD(P)-dependent nickel-iron de
MSVSTLTIDGQAVAMAVGATLLEAAREVGIAIPTLCHLEGLSPVAACRLCLVEIEGSGKLQPACITPVLEGMVVRTDSPTLRDYRRTVIELLFTEGNHVCAVCVANGHCELQDRAVEVGMDHSRLPYRFPDRAVDLSHQRFGLDHNRCILCTRCVRVCDEVEGAHVWDVAWRGEHCRIIAGLDQPWGAVDACTDCGKCVMVCPTGALFPKGDTVEEKHEDPSQLVALLRARQARQGAPP